MNAFRGCGLHRQRAAYRNRAAGSRLTGGCNSGSRRDTLPTRDGSRALDADARVWWRRVAIVCVVSVFLCVRAVAQEGYYGHDRWHIEFLLNRNDGKSACSSLMDCRAFFLKDVPSAFSRLASRRHRASSIRSRFNGRERNACGMRWCQSRGMLSREKLRIPPRLAAMGLLPIVRSDRAICLEVRAR